jgi:L-ribulokinase
MLSAAWAKKLGLPAGIPVAIGAFDAHLGGVGSGIQPGTLVKIIGTSTCDMAISDSTKKLKDIPGICGIVDGSILPGYWGLEAGQSAVGDIFNWYVNYIQPGGEKAGSHVELTNKAAKLKPGQSGLLALDWNNGNRTILVDQRLTGLLVGQTLHTRPEEIYRALIEATAFGALTIINRFEEYGVKIKQIVNCGGIAEKNPMLMQIYADVTGREVQVAFYDPDRAMQNCAWNASCATTPSNCPGGITYLGWDPVQGGNRCNRGSGVGRTSGSWVWTKLVSMCRPTFKPAAWHLSTVALRLSSPPGKFLRLIGYEPSDDAHVPS